MTLVPSLRFQFQNEIKKEPKYCRRKYCSYIIKPIKVQESRDNIDELILALGIKKDERNFFQRAIALSSAHSDRSIKKVEL